MHAWVSEGDDARTASGRGARSSRRDRTRPVAQERARRERRPQDKYARLVSAAIVVFGDEGYARATVKAICGAAKVSVGTFYDHFDDKADLMRHIAEEALEGPPGPDLSSLGALDRSIGALLNSPIAGFARAWLEAVGADPQLRASHARLRPVNVDRYSVWVREARAGHRARSRLDDAIAGRAVIALLKEAITMTAESAEERAAAAAGAIWLVVFGTEDGGHSAAGMRGPGRRAT